MTNTLHRYGKSESFFDDYIVFSLPAKSKAAGQTGDALAAQKRFMQIAAEYKPVSLGDALHGGTLRPTKSKSIFGHWGKRNRPNFKKVLEGMSKAGTMAAVFDKRENAEAFVKRINTQVVVGVGVRCDEDGEEKIVLPILEKLGYNPQRAKTNIGLGRKVIRDLSNAAPTQMAKEMVNA